jgi:hypothetical protein
VALGALIVTRRLAGNPGRRIGLEGAGDGRHFLQVCVGVESLAVEDLNGIEGENF